MVAALAEISERCEHPRRERDYAAAVPALRCVDAVVEATLDEDAVLLEVDVVPAQRDCLTEAKAGVDEELDEQSILRRHFAKEPRRLLLVQRPCVDRVRDGRRGCAGRERRRRGCG